MYCMAVAIKMTEQAEQQIGIEFCVKLEQSCTETTQMIQKAFRDNAMSVAYIKVWHRCFKDGREPVESDPHSGRPAIGRTHEEVEHVWAAINKDRRLTVWELEADLQIPKTTASKILMQDLGMKHVVRSFHGFCYQSRRNIVLQLGELCEVPRCLL